MKRLIHIAIPHGEIPRLNSVGPSEPNRAAEAEKLAFSAQCIAALKTESASPVVHDPEYLEILNKYKDILKPNFKEAKTKHGIEHAIKTTGTP